MGMVADWAQEIADKIAAEGVRAVIDPRDASPPCVLVSMPPTRQRANACTYEYAWQIYCLAAGPGNLDAALALEDLFTAVDAALMVDGGYPQPYIPSMGKQIPAYLSVYREVR